MQSLNERSKWERAFVPIPLTALPRKVIPKYSCYGSLAFGIRNRHEVQFLL